MAKRVLREGMTAQQLRALLHYDPDTGNFRWREGIDHWRAGLPAGTFSRSGGSRPCTVIGIGTTSERRYAHVGIRKSVYLAHRLAWLYVYGEWPSRDIDHINGDARDNRIANLRLATNAENARNRGLRRDNTSGFKGVHRIKRSGKWCVHCSINGKVHCIGNFDTIEEAAAAYREAAFRLHGQFARVD